MKQYLNVAAPGLVGAACLITDILTKKVGTGWLIVEGGLILFSLFAIWATWFTNREEN